MWNPVITPEIALMLKRNEVDSEEALSLAAAHNTLMTNKHRAKWDDALTEEESDDCATDLAEWLTDWELQFDSRITTGIEKRLRRQGLRTIEDSYRPEVLSISKCLCPLSCHRQCHTIQASECRHSIKVHALMQSDTGAERIYFYQGV